MNAVFLTGFGTYLRDHGLALMASCINRGQHVHATIGNVPEVCRPHLLGMRESGLLVIDEYDEPITDTRGFYSSIRLTILPRILRLYDAVLQVDTDAILNRPVDWDDHRTSLGFSKEKYVNGRRNGFDDKAFTCHGFATYVRNDGDGRGAVDWMEKKLIDLCNERGFRWGDEVRVQNLASDEFVHHDLPMSYWDKKMQDESILWQAKHTRKAEKRYVEKQCEEFPELRSILDDHPREKRIEHIDYSRDGSDSQPNESYGKR